MVSFHNFDEDIRIRRRVSGDGNSTLIVGSDGSSSVAKPGKYFELSIWRMHRISLKFPPKIDSVQISGMEKGFLCKCRVAKIVWLAVGGAVIKFLYLSARERKLSAVLVKYSVISPLLIEINWHNIFFWIRATFISLKLKLTSESWLLRQFSKNIGPRPGRSTDTPKARRCARDCQVDNKWVSEWHIYFILTLFVWLARYLNVSTEH